VLEDLSALPPASQHLRLPEGGRVQGEDGHPFPAVRVRAFHQGE